MIGQPDPRLVSELIPGEGRFRCSFRDGSSAEVTPFLGRFLRVHDGLSFLSTTSTEVLVARKTSTSRPQQFLSATIGYVCQPKPNDRAGFLVRAELPNCSNRPQSLWLTAAALRRYFYLLEDENAGQSLYALLQVPDSPDLTQIRLAWRVRSVELAALQSNVRQRSQVERAFNVLAHPDLRRCYDALRKDPDAPPLFPYGGFGSILVEGKLSPDGEVFFANRILAYKPEMTARSVSLLLRQCEFLADRVVCRDRRRKLEVSLDSSLLPGVDWDLTWNHWKHWLVSRIDVDATFVRSGKYRLRKGDWVLRTWYTALPSRLRVSLPDGLTADVERAKEIHALLGEHAKLVEKIRAEVEKQAVEHVQVQDWFDRVGASPHLGPQHVTWRPDYEPYYFEQVRKRSTTWFLFRDEYLFVWRSVLISEIPEPGHATYVFAKPADVRVFLRRYSQATREDIRLNRENIASELGFVGRVVRGRKKWRWINDVLKVAGEKADYVEVFE